MTTLKEQIGSAVILALRQGEKSRLTTLRGLLAEIQVEEKKREVGTVLTEEQALGVIMREHKRFEEALGFAEQAKRGDLITAAHESLGVVEEFLPAQVTEDIVTQWIQEIIAQEGPFALKDFGRLMKSLSPRIKGKFDGKRASELAKTALV
jgi:uncharacterized protein YqeY